MPFQSLEQTDSWGLSRGNLNQTGVTTTCPLPNTDTHNTLPVFSYSLYAETHTDLLIALLISELAETECSSLGD